jgi:hypothetical protein
MPRNEVNINVWVNELVAVDQMHKDLELRVGSLAFRMPICIAFVIMNLIHFVTNSYAFST